jgi:type II secretory ATPase GspE/PulE/Tfp pilus assembly ATPase PilB-like protein
VITYVSPFKIAFVMVMFSLWCLCLQWVDRDAQRVKTIRERWNILCLSFGLLALAAWVLIPMDSMALFFMGWGVYVVVAGAGVLWYVAHRNQRVADKYKVLTPQHFTRLLQRGGGAKLDRSKHEYRVRLFDHQGHSVTLPEDEEGADQFSTTQDLLYDALWRRAMVIELAAVGGETRLNYVIDGVTAERRDLLDQEQATRTISFLKNVAGLNPEEKRRPQQGSIKAGLLGGTEPARISVRVSGTTAGERLQLKIVGAHTQLSIDDIGLHPQRVEKLKEIIAQPSGLVIDCGPPGSGVTTTLYALVRKHDAYIQNIHSLEKQRLFEVDNITQNAFDPTNREANYCRQLQSVLRREPDVVLVGELDDKETAHVVVKACVEGRKIYAGMTADDSFDCLQLFLNLVGSTKAVAKVLKGIVAQRLVRKLCPTCREAYKPDANLLRKANLPVDKIEHFYRPPTQQVFDKQGREVICPTCQGTGHVDRVGIFEVLVIDEPLQRLVADGAALTLIKAQARKNKMLYLQEEGLLKTMDGVTSINEILRAMRSSNNRR